MYDYMNQINLQKKNNKKYFTSNNINYCNKKINTKPLFSIITPVLNGGKHLERTINSVINQSFQDFEYLIIDGCSTDDTLEIIKKYEYELDLWLSEPDEGIYDAMNKGIDLAEGKVIGIINSDDWYEKEALQIVSNFFQGNNFDKILHGSLNYIYKSKIFHKAHSPKNLLSLNKLMIINHPSTFIPKIIYEKHGKYSNEFVVCGDWEIMLRFYNKKIDFINFDEVIANFSYGGKGTKFNINVARERHQIRKKYKGYNFYDTKYLYDLIKLWIFKNYSSKISNIYFKFLIFKFIIIDWLLNRYRK